MNFFLRAGCIAILFYLQGCSGCIKRKSSQEQLTGAGSKSSIPVPIVTNNLIVKNVNDLTGYWAGEFGPEITPQGSTQEDEAEDYQQFPTINISLDTIDGTSVKGHTVLCGKVRFFTCNMTTSGPTYNFTFKGGSNEKTDGTYKFSITRGDSLLKGRWDPHKNTVPIHEYQLTKRLFKYNPNAKLVEGRYVNYSKEKKVNIKVDTSSYISEQFATTSDDVTKYNASARLLIKDDVANLKKADLLVLRNSIFARHGYIFKKDALDLYFSEQPWYVPVNTDVTAALTEIEKKNIQLLMRYEKTAREYYDTFGR